MRICGQALWDVLIFQAWPVKRYKLARATLQRLQARWPEVELVTMTGRGQSEVARAMNACQALLVASAHEGAPNMVKEAMACNLPIVSTRVGDVEEMFDGLPGHFLSDPEPDTMAASLGRALDWGRTSARERITERFSLAITARRIHAIYESVS